MVQRPREQEPPSRHLPIARYRHHLWFVDIRYLVKIEGRWVYSICMLEGYSRTILAGMASEHQDLPALLQLLFAALSTYGCPEGIVSDHGAVFQAHDYVAILQALEIEPKYIELRKPWQNLIEAQFKVQLRLADFQFEQQRDGGAALTPRSLKPLIPRGTGRIRTAPITDGPRWTSWAGCTGVLSTLSGSDTSLAGCSSCGP